MNRYDSFGRILKELQLINDEIKKNWNSESSEIFCTSLDDSIHYMKKITENFRDELENSEAEKTSLSDFSF